MSPQYNYIGYGLKIRSDLYFPEFIPSLDDAEDIRIVLSGQGQMWDIQTDESKSFSKETEQGTYFQVARVARYLVKDGQEIEVNPFEGSDPGAVRLFLLSNAMAILLIQRGQILLHASAIRREHGLVVFLGDSGAGKSSMLAELIRRGYEPFSDDVIVIDENPETGEIMAIPSYPMIKLWKESTDILGTDSIGEGHQLRRGIDKYGYYFHNRYLQDPMRIQQVLVIEKDPDCENYRVTEPGGLDSFEILSGNIYRRQFIQDASLRKKHLLVTSKLLQQAGIKVLTRSAEHSTIPSFADFTEMQFTEEGKQK